jgi:nicotinate-nucleotide adenylyltransferase
MRLGIFGGTFDPVHYGHLLLAECCREQLGLNELWFVPAAVPPHKQGRELTPGSLRAEMLELAIAGHTALRVCRYEIDRGGVSYTVDTLAHVRSEHPDAELFFLLGADSLRDLPGWRDPVRLCELATPVVVGRVSHPGIEAASALDYGPLAEILSAERIAQIRGHRVEMPLVELSSSDIRRRVATGRSIRFRTPRAVEQFIADKQLYRKLD